MSSQLMVLYQQVDLFNEKPMYRYLPERNVCDLCATLGFTMDHHPKSVASLLKATTTTTERRGHPFNTSSEEQKV